MIRVAWEKAVVVLRVPVEGTLAGARDEFEVPLRVLFPTEAEFREVAMRLSNYQPEGSSPYAPSSKGKQ